MKKILFLALLSLAFASCETDEAKYKPTGNDVSFAQPSSSFKLAEGQKITVQLNRGVAKEAVTVPITLIDDNNIFTLDNAAVAFGVNEYQKEVILSYDVTEFTPGKQYKFALKAPKESIGPAGLSQFEGSAMLPLNYLPYCKASYYYSQIPNLSTMKYMWSDTKPALADLIDTPVSLDRAEYTTTFFRLNCLYDIQIEFTYDYTLGDDAECVINTQDNPKIVGSLIGSSAPFDFRTTINGTVYDWAFRSMELEIDDSNAGYHPAPGDDFAIDSWVIKNKSSFVFGGYNSYDYILLDELIEQ